MKHTYVTTGYVTTCEVCGYVAKTYDDFFRGGCVVSNGKAKSAVHGAGSVSDRLDALEETVRLQTNLVSKLTSEEWDIGGQLRYLEERVEKLEVWLPRERLKQIKEEVAGGLGEKPESHVQVQTIHPFGKEEVSLLRVLVHREMDHLDEERTPRTVKELNVANDRMARMRALMGKLNDMTWVDPLPEGFGTYDIRKPPPWPLSDI